VSDEVETESERLEEAAGSSGAPPATTVTAAKPAPGGHRPKKTAQEPGLFARIGQFLRDTRAEMRRVSWPTLATVRDTTLITLVAVVFFAVYLFAVDRVWTFLLDNLRGWLGG
jgi:preprotein translocase subunit SecE